jgi:hypothetical protein
MNMVTTNTVMSYFRQNDKLVLAWRDKYTVMIVSTFHSETKNKVPEVPCRYPNKPPIKPSVKVDYTKYMGEVNHSDHYIASYQLMRIKT